MFQMVDNIHTMSKPFIYVVTICLIIKICKSDPVTVQLGNGEKIKGAQGTTVDSKKPYVAFKGIPYATPPINDLRFKNPVPFMGDESTVIDATQFHEPCWQTSFELDLNLGKPFGSEDCLYLNVFKPKEGTKLPVYVFVPGGYFEDGNPNEYGPDFFLDSGIVVVTISYRLGIFGFLSSGDNASPGNFGIKDVILGLEWVHQNIDIFGGDKDAVTLGGQNSGGAIVDFITQYSPANGLYRSVIIESMNSLSVVALSRDSSKVFDLIVDAAGIILPHNSETKVQYLREVNATKLQNETFLFDLGDVAFGNVMNSLPFGPVIEKDATDGVVTQPMEDNFKKGNYNNVPRLMGFNSNEAGLIVNDFLSKIGVIEYKYRIDPWLFVPASLNIGIIKEATSAVSINVEYFQGIMGINSTSLQRFLSDDWFIRPMVKEISLISDASNIYMYNFSFASYLGNPNRTHPGVADGEELNYLWYRPTQQPLTPAEQITRQRLITLWANFIKTSNPTPTRDSHLNNIVWTPAKSDNLNMLVIDNDLHMEVYNDSTVLTFWENLFKKGSKPFSTY